MGHQGHFTRNRMINQELIPDSLNSWGRWPCTRRRMRRLSSHGLPRQQTVPRVSDQRRRRRRHFWGSSLGLRLPLISSRHAVIRSQLLLRKELLLSQELSTSIPLSIPC